MDDVQALLSDILGIILECWQETVAGIYLHGSLAMGCFQPAWSDMDLLIVTYTPMTKGRKRQLIDLILSRLKEERIHLEFSAVQESSLISVVYPTWCELHYSTAHKHAYLSDPAYLCGGYQDHDLASQIAVAYERGQVLYGLPLREQYPPVPAAAYRSSIMHDIASADHDIVQNPMYYCLNLCRVLCYLLEGRITSKRESGEWGLSYLKGEQREIVRLYLAAYTYGVLDRRVPEPERLKRYARFMLAQIQHAAADLNNCTITDQE
ncbi:DUF4111 domain-containing protein [Paenibacillus sp. JX-17]|uniref:Spectinomycin 9-adenylyltransferase n=1 Tax=Paenibacillus lacisoli TaxID=3064525 RepID=A0ABT9CAR7_9BACL|nr:aminoglycoside adenylyltransferase domain-containing protein [Paenibacillus sp. JX-17]MDO7905965.1 DUF4111 domain-containing protein [Paenibacillus sp. JX-17]